MTQNFSNIATGSGGGLAKNVMSTLNWGVKTALFMEQMRNLNWSRGYLWYVELDGVPNPFQRGGVLGLPCKSVSFNLAQGKTFPIQQFMTDLSVPLRVGSMDTIQLSVYDDEQGTLRTFFERWYNQIYNPYKGVLPLTEAVKQITIYFQRSTRRNLKRTYYDIDKSISGLGIGRITEGYDYLVYPSENIRLDVSSDQNDVISFNVQLEIAQYINQDFGMPSKKAASASLLSSALGANTNTWLNNLANYF